MCALCVRVRARARVCVCMCACCDSDAVDAHGKGLIEVRRLDAARDIAATLARSRGVTYLPGGNSGNLLLNLPAQ